jgi:uncharacterized oligopeptide transporter (OPT) family protein
MLISGQAILPMVAGGLFQWAWSEASPRTEERYCLPLSSGFIAGEALVVLVFAIQVSCSAYDLLVTSTIPRSPSTFTQSPVSITASGS